MHPLEAEKRAQTVKSEAVMSVITWDEPKVVQLESCNSCGTNKDGGS